ncbi:MAG: S9 family peptidase, partial [Rubrivivax sp.]|nr:S9 family peptidase [Rubrivivax sp.]
MTMASVSTLSLTGICLGLLAGCAQLPTPPAAGAVFTPNANLVVQGVPAIPQALVDRVQRYTDFRGHGFVDWHPTRREMLVTHRAEGGSTTQLFLLRAPLAAPEPLTDGAEPVRSGRFEPVEGRYIVFPRSRGGDEADQLYRLDLDGRQTTLLTDPTQRHSLMAWRKRAGEIIYSSVPLDRTAQGGSRASIGVSVWAADPLQP